MSYDLVMFSGGIDSTYVAYDFLVNNPQKQLLIHHIKLQNRENRAYVEGIACKRIIEYFKQNNLNNFFYSESSFDYGDIKYLIYDIEIVAFKIYLLLRHRYFNIQNIWLPFYMNKSRGRYNKFFKIVGLCNRQVNFLYPIKDMTKCEVMDKLPKDLLELTWYCRRPIQNKPCGSCATCLEVMGYSGGE